MENKYKSPTIRVEWEDYPENFTKERKLRVKSYFQKKYNTQKISIVLKPKKIKQSEQTEIISENLFDLNYQKKLIKEYVSLNGNNIDSEFIERLDDKVNERLVTKKDLSFKINECKIKSIQFSNFLSYGDDNQINFERIPGITIINSNPENQGGKTTLLNAIVFLLFGSTFSTKKNEEIFNLYTDKNEVKVSGIIQIDDHDFRLDRTLSRKPKKKGSAEWSYSSVFNFFKLNPDGTEVNETEEQRKETEKVLKQNIGDIDDFLLTIIATSDNLEDLIHAGATDRGKIFSRFMGLDILQEKGDIGKTLYAEYQKGLKSNQYNTEQLKGEIDLHKEEISNIKEDILDRQNKIDAIKLDIEALIIQKDNLLKDVVKIDPEVVKLSYTTLLSDKSTSETTLLEKETQHKNLKTNIDGLEHHYEETKYNSLLEKEKELLSILSKYKSNLDTIKEENTKLELKLSEKDLIDKTIIDLENKIKEKESSILEHLFNQEVLDTLNEEHKSLALESNHNSMDKVSTQKLIKQLEEGEFCPTCKRKLEDVDHTEEINQLKDKVSKIEIIIDNNIKDLTELSRKIDVQKGEKLKLDNNLLIEREIEKLKSSIEINKTRLESMTEAQNTIETNKGRISKGEELIKTKQSELDVILEDIKYQKEQKGILDTKLNNEILLSRIELEVERLKNKLNTILSNIQKYEDNVVNIENNRAIEAKTNVLQFDINTKSAQMNGYLEDIAVFQVNIDNINKSILDKENTIKTIAIEEKYVKTFDFYIEMFGKNGIVKLILRDKIPYINDRLNDLLGDLTNFSIKVNMNDKKELEFVMSDNATGLDKFLYTGSGFERTMGALALRQVLVEINCLPKFNMLFLDEVLGKVGKMNLDKVEMLLSRIKDSYDNVMFITHNEETKSWGDFNIVVTKEDNISRIDLIGMN
jgi:DNA repair exonuclease SbcCD ATPase subunit